MKPLESTLLGAATMIVVDDLALSVKFYRDKLGFEVVEAFDTIVALSRGPMLLQLFTHSPPTPDKPGITLTNSSTGDATSVVLEFIVTDCRRAYDELLDIGVEFLTPPHEPPWGGLRCFARDPSGYLIEIEESPASPFVTHQLISGTRP
jgi:catechol 2,3-dioxygenase-like lactoylglutathione lyase family enzyme